MKRRARVKGARKGASSGEKKQIVAAHKIVDKPSVKQTAAEKIPAGIRAIDIGKIWDQIGKTRAPKEFRVTCFRPDDLLVCDFIFDNLELADAKTLARKDPNASVTLIVELPPQSFGEQAFLDATGPDVKSPLPAKETFDETSKAANAKNVPTAKAEDHGALPFAKIRMAGRSRIAFSMPADEKTLSFNIDAILDACRRWPMQLDVNAAPEPQFTRYGGLQDLSVFDENWLANVISSPSWATATQTLIDALGGPRKAKRPLADAAQRIASQAAQALRTGATRGLNAALVRAMNAEIDALTSRLPIRKPQRREIAIAALSVMTTRAFGQANISEFTIGRIKDLPFFLAPFAPHKPSPLATALELPYRVLLSPIPEANWWHAIQPVVHNGRTELWHTRLTNTSDGIGADAATKVRALWSPDFRGNPADPEIIDVVNNVKPFRISLDPLDRLMLVKLMAGFTDTDVHGHSYVPHAAVSNRLALSALGALLDAEGSWDTQPADVGLEQWRHLATLGRDHYVRVVYKGFLCPFGHSASLIKVTERKFEYSDTNKNNRVAVLRQRFFIAVRERVKAYSGAGHAFGGRNFPFTSVELLTRVTPSLVAPTDVQTHLSDASIYAAVPARSCFWPILGPNNDFKFQIAATDLCGDRVTFAMPLLFVGIEANQSDVVMPKIIGIQKGYNAEPAARRTAGLGGAALCYAPQKATAEGDTRLPTGETSFDAAGVIGISRSKPQFYPEIETAQVGITAIQRLLQKTDNYPVTYPKVYKENGFGPLNSGEVFLILKTDNPADERFALEFGDKVKSDALGGLATPSMAIQGLSRVMGPVAAKPPANPADIENALGNIINNAFDPTDFFQGAKILGGVELARILETAGSLAGEDVPKLVSKQTIDKVEASFDWKTNINKSDPPGVFVPNPDGAQTVLEMHGVVSSPIGQTAEPTFNATASITNFKVNLFGFITIWLDALTFVSKSGSKPDVSVDLHPGEHTIEFGGPLEFVNTLRQIIPSNGFSDPPSLSVTPSGIAASYSLNIPSVAVGIFALEHVSIGAGFALPFDAKPAEVHFNFSERQRPFSLTVSLLGGGGFFAIGVDTSGVQEIEAALEFGAAVSINLGVASGGVEIKAGVYFHWMTKSVELAGYVRLHGELSVLGLISASLTFNLQLAYLKETGHSVVWGEATLEVEIEILFFSASVSVKCRREFAGSDADPKFIELIPDQATWTSYCEAFAAEAA